MLTACKWVEKIRKYKIKFYKIGIYLKFWDTVSKNDNTSIMADSDLASPKILKIWIISIDHFQFYSSFGALFWPSDGSDMKHHGRFGFGIPKTLKMIYLWYMNHFNQTIWILPFPLGTLFGPQMGADMQHSDWFEFGIPKNTEIDVWVVPIKHFDFYSPFWASFWSPDWANLKNNYRFRFSIPKNSEIDF